MPKFIEVHMINAKDYDESKYPMGDTDEGVRLLVNTDCISLINANGDNAELSIKYSYDMDNSIKAVIKVKESYFSLRNQLI